MSLPLVTRPAAAAEIETAYRWYEKEREGLGSEFLEAVEKMVKAIAEDPERFPAIRKDIRRAVLRRFPYSIFYRIVSGHVVVIACFHGKRKFGGYASNARSVDCEARCWGAVPGEELYFQYLSKRPLNLIDFMPVYNLCPTQSTLVLRLVDGERQFEEMRWQLVPNFEPGFTTKFSTINAKSETVFESRLFGDLVVRQRCIVPLSGFFEWKTDGQRKWPFKIHLQNKAIMSLAGIWETWRPGTPHERRSFSILTTSANRFMRAIHDRIPVILDNSAEEDWLDPEIQERKALKEILQPCPNEGLTAVEVSPLVNSAKNNGPELLQPVVANHTENPPQRDLFAD
ncbi:MAG: hypothetical protein DMG13_05545 [Acidobacteria bacterium]|nr:MAG: hypothetical protein DMG13_05545 [Acidobacteriota bacterium]